ncbi:hypothetical protein J6590_043284 [Homalodisca vitripennis]|nr:hypothetical protein J6590_043284 [Homalodisca vitripennis]
MAFRSEAKIFQELNCVRNVSKWCEAENLDVSYDGTCLTLKSYNLSTAPTATGPAFYTLSKCIQSNGHPPTATGLGWAGPGRSQWAGVHLIACISTSQKGRAGRSRHRALIEVGYYCAKIKC